jgi:toxin ParE1/3/4
MAHDVSPEAAEDLDAIWYYVASESGSTDRADRIVDAITERFYLLSAHPRLGRARDDLRPGLRSFTVSDYIILYRITDADDVLILHVPHGRRDLRRIVSTGEPT